MTLTGWSFIMFRTIDNSSPFAGVYFYTLVLVAAYFMVCSIATLRVVARYPPGRMTYSFKLEGQLNSNG